MNQTVFITGVSSGIGYGLARQYLDRGDHVFGVSRRTPTGLECENFHFLSLDLRDESEMKKTLPEFLAGVNQLNAVVLNAGILGRIGDMKDTTIEDMKKIMDVNVWACKSVLDVLIGLCKKIDKVIAISSGAAVNGNRGWNGYSISKAALNMLTMLYARENPDVHFSAVAPGLVDTAMQDYLCEHETDTRFPSLESLKSKRGTTDMPNPLEAAKKLIMLFDSVENHVETGGFVDIRHLPEFSQM